MPAEHARPIASPSSLRAVPFPETVAAGEKGAHSTPSGGRVRWILAADLVAVYVALALTYAAASALAPPAVVGPTVAAAWLLVAAGPVWLAIFAGYRLYERQVLGFSPPGLDELANLFHALLAGSLVLLLVGQALRRFAELSMYTPIEAALFLSAAIVTVPLARGATRTWLLPAVARPRRTLIVGAGAVGRMVADRIGAHPQYGLELVGYVEDDPPADAGQPVVGRVDQLTRLVDELEIDWVVIAFASVPYERMHELVRAVRRPDVHLSIVPRYFELFASNAMIEDVQGMPILSLPPMRLSRAVVVLKRAVDLLGAGLGLLLLSPLLAAIAAAIRLDGGGPVFFRQARRGRGGSTFEIVKFRTMVAGAERRRFELASQNEVTGPLFKIREDPRITRVGAFLRRTSLDELPQLWNVVKGEMSLVGPRPFVIHEADQITGWAGRRLDLTPGITGLWQVMGRNDLTFDEMAKLDYVYVTNWSLWWDIKILLRTIPVVLARRGAY